MEMNQNKQNNILLLILFMQCTQCYFIDYGTMPGAEQPSLGAIVKHEAGRQNIYYFNFNQTTTPAVRRNLQKLNGFEYYFGKQNTKNYLYNASQNIGSILNPAFQKQANNDPEMQGVRNMYLAMGVPKEVIEQGYVPFLKARFNFVNSTLSQSAYPEHQQILLGRVYGSLKQVKQITDALLDNYLKDVKIVVYGLNNKAIGKKLFISTDIMIANADNTFIYNGGGANNRVTGKNIMRTNRYEINFDQLQAIKRGQVGKCIKIIQ